MARIRDSKAPGIFSQFTLEKWPKSVKTAFPLIKTQEYGKIKDLMFYHELDC